MWIWWESYLREIMKDLACQVKDFSYKWWGTSQGVWEDETRPNLWFWEVILGVLSKISQRVKMLNFRLCILPQSISQSEGTAAGTGEKMMKDLDQGRGNRDNVMRMDPRDMKETEWTRQRLLYVGKRKLIWATKQMVEAFPSRNTRGNSVCNVSSEKDRENLT